jgi:hypothetical protein
MSTNYIAHCPHDHTHPQALAVYCSDGRFTQAVEELAHSLGFARVDTLTIPGGPALLELTSGTMAAVETVRNGVAFLVEGHKIAHVLLVAHEGCGYYRNRFPYDSPDAMRRRQISDLHSAGRYAMTTRGGIKLSKYYASAVDGHVAFEAFE